MLTSENFKQHCVWVKNTLQCKKKKISLTVNNNYILIPQQLIENDAPLYSCVFCHFLTVEICWNWKLFKVRCLTKAENSKSKYCFFFFLLSQVSFFQDNKNELSLPADKKHVTFSQFVIYNLSSILVKTVKAGHVESLVRKSLTFFSFLAFFDSLFDSFFFF